MCGIFAYIGDKETAGTLILEGLKSLEYRGYDSWGIVIKKTDGSTHVEKHIGRIGRASFPRFSSQIGIGHTRWATHGGVVEKNSHPHADCTGKILIVHNGIVENFEEIKRDLIKKGHRFKSDTDSEVIAHLVEEKSKHSTNSRKIIRDVFDSLKGMNAIIVFYPEKDCFYAIKNGSPIVFGKSKQETIIASDSSAISPFTKKVYFLNDGELLEIQAKKTSLFGENGKKKSFDYITLNFGMEEGKLGAYPHFMIKEIHEQPKVLQNIINTQKKTITDLSKVIKHAYGTYFIGCGTAFYASLAGTYLFSKIAKRHVNASVGSEFSYLIDFLKKDSLVIALSQSGETIDIISSAKKIKEKGTKLLTITNTLGSTLYRMADYKMLLNAGPEKCVLATKSFTSKIAVLNLLAHSLNGGFEKGAKEIKNAAGEVVKLIQSNTMKKLAQRLKNHRHIYIIGRGISYPTALESALKIKEVSYIHAEGLAGGELKHGVIALVEKGTPVIVYNPEDETYEDTLSSAYEVKARGAFTIGISSKSNPVYDEFIRVENCGNATVIPNVVVAQLLGYYLALSKKLDPDKPRNLAKSVTVK